MDLWKIGRYIGRTAGCPTSPLALPVVAALRVAKYSMRRSGVIARLLRYPNPLKRPCNRPRLELARDRGLGDVLMCTPVLRELKRRNPHCYIRFYTQFQPLVERVALHRRGTSLRPETPRSTLHGIRARSAARSTDIANHG